MENVINYEREYKRILKLESVIGKEIGNLKEKDLQKLLKKTLFKNIVKMEYQYSGHDCEVGNVVIELKCRRSHYKNLLIEKKKYDYLTQFEKKYYLCSTPCGIYMCNLSNVELKPEWEWTWQPKHTEFPDGEKILKQTYYIPQELTINLTPKIMKGLKNYLKNKIEQNGHKDNVN